MKEKVTHRDAIRTLSVCVCIITWMQDTLTQFTFMHVVATDIHLWKSFAFCKPYKIERKRERKRAFTYLTLFLSCPYVKLPFNSANKSQKV